MRSIVWTLNSNSGISQQFLSARYKVDQRTIGRNLKQRTKIRPRKRIRAPKYIKDQQYRAKKHCGFLYRHIPNNYYIIIDDEKYFGLTGVDIPGNSFYYTSDHSTTPSNIKYKQYRKFEPKLTEGEKSALEKRGIFWRAFEGETWEPSEQIKCSNILWLIWGFLNYVKGKKLNYFAEHRH